MRHFYRAQTKFAKVMFLQVSVCPWGGACVAGGMHGGGAHGGGHAWQGACMAGEGCAWWGGMHGRGGAAWRGACVAGGHAWQILRDTVIRSMSRRYASYWNAFLLLDTIKEAQKVYI